MISYRRVQGEGHESLYTVLVARYGPQSVASASWLKGGGKKEKEIAQRCSFERVSVRFVRHSARVAVANRTFVIAAIAIDTLARGKNYAAEIRAHYARLRR